MTDRTTGRADRYRRGVTRPTIYDVAREAGVSPSTVSRAFSRPGRVSSETARRVREVADRLGYRAEEVFRVPAPVRSKLIALAVSDIANPFYYPIIRGAEHAVAAEGFTLVLADAQESDRREREMLPRILPHIDGLVIASSRISDTDLRSLARTVPMVVLNRPVAGLTSVLPDTPRAVRRAVEHLASLGHRRICYVPGPEASYVDGARWRNLREACHELDLCDSRVARVPPTVCGGEAAAAAVIAKGARAVLAYNDLVAIGVMRGLHAAGYRVPEDFSVVGFDNTIASDLVTPTLTTVAAPLVKLGAVAVQNVLALAAGATHRAPEPTVVPVRLVVRKSTAPPPAG